MKDRLSRGTKKLARERQDVRCPCADGHHDDVARDPLSIVEHNPNHAIIAFIQLRKSSAFAQFDAE